jgi:hypothetical protein
MYLPIHTAWVFLTVLLSAFFKKVVTSQVTLSLLMLAMPKQQPVQKQWPNHARPLSWTDFSSTKSYGNRSIDAWIDPKYFNHPLPEWEQSERFRPNGELKWFLGSHWQDLLTRGLMFSMPHGKNRDNVYFKDMNDPYNHSIACALVHLQEQKAMQQPKPAIFNYRQVVGIVIVLLAAFFYLSPTASVQPPVAVSAAVQNDTVQIAVLQTMLSAQATEIADLKAQIKLAQQPNPQDNLQQQQIEALQNLTNAVARLQHQRRRR